MSDHLVRIENLKAIQRANGWTDSELGRQCGRPPQQVRAWWIGERRIGERLARALEGKLGLTRYALDERPGAPPKVGIPASGSPDGSQVSVTRSAWEAPIVGWAEIDQMLNSDNTGLRAKAPHLETFAVASSRAKFVQMPDDSMAPTIRAGDHLLLDPTEAPRAGDIVLIKHRETGEHFVRMFRPRTAHAFEAVPANANYQPLNSSDDEIEVAGVMVEHRSYRRR